MFHAVVSRGLLLLALAPHGILRPMKPEALFRLRLLPRLHHLALWQRHEDKYMPDIPDMSFVLRDGSGVCGWVELKVGQATKSGLALPHLRPGQINWLNRHGELSPHVFLVVGVDGEELWIPGRLVTHEMRFERCPLDWWRALHSPPPYFTAGPASDA